MALNVCVRVRLASASRLQCSPGLAALAAPRPKALKLAQPPRSPCPRPSMSTTTPPSEEMKHMLLQLLQEHAAAALPRPATPAPPPPALPTRPWAMTWPSPASQPSYWPPTPPTLPRAPALDTRMLARDLRDGPMPDSPGCLPQGIVCANTSPYVASVCCHAHPRGSRPHLASFARCVAACNPLAMLPHPRTMSMLSPVARLTPQFGLP